MRDTVFERKNLREMFEYRTIRVFKPYKVFSRHISKQNAMHDI
jgi:hypothetical protein